MSADPVTLFEILGVPQNADDERIQKGYDDWVVRCLRRDKDLPDAVESAYQILSNPETKEQYTKLLEARRRNIPVLMKTDEVAALQEFCQATLLQPWLCPEGMVGPDGHLASLGEVLFVIRLFGERSPFPPPQEPVREPIPAWVRLVRTAMWMLFLLCVTGGGYWWYHNQYHAAERLEETIRHDDADISSLLLSVTNQEVEFQRQVSSVVGHLPADGSMPDDLARVCFREKTAARAWEEVRNRQTLPSAIEPLDNSRKAVEQRISMNTFADSDAATLRDVKSSLNQKNASFIELRRDLDLLRVLLEAERLPHSQANTRQEKEEC